ncbi:hypothetical protein P9112_001837 [Eukaryota sp. TZLM1-RC]
MSTAAVKSLQRQDGNKLCVDCNKPGTSNCVFLPENIGVFTCTHCAGIHRQFNHRTKGILASEFTDEDVQLLKNGGNRIANSLYMARHNPDTHPIPTKPSIPELKKFLEAKYDAKRWFGEVQQPKQPKPSPSPAAFDNFFTDAPEFATSTAATSSMTSSPIDTRQQDSLFGESFLSVTKPVAKQSPKEEKGDILSLFGNSMGQKEVQKTKNPGKSDFFDSFGVNESQTKPLSKPQSNQQSVSQSEPFGDFFKESSKPVEKTDDFFDNFEPAGSSFASSSPFGKATGGNVSDLFDEISVSKPKKEKKKETADDFFGDFESSSKPKIQKTSGDFFDDFGAFEDTKPPKTDDFFGDFESSSKPKIQKTSGDFFDDFGAFEDKKPPKTDDFFGDVVHSEPKSVQKVDDFFDSVGESTSNPIQSNNFDFF